MPSPMPTFPINIYNGSLEWFILSGLTPVYNYVDKQRQGDTPIAWRVNVALPGNSLAPLSVKIEGPTRPLAVTDEQITDSLASLRFVLVNFVEGQVRLYTMNGKIQASASAHSVELVKSSK